MMTTFGSYMAEEAMKIVFKKNQKKNQTVRSHTSKQ